MAVLLPPNAIGYEIAPANGRTFTLDELQALVGGYIEGLRVPGGHWLMINEDGKRLQLPYNDAATTLMRALLRPDDVIVGPAVLCTPLEAGEDSDGEPGKHSQ
jgi:hypothetical protein